MDKGVGGAADAEEGKCGRTVRGVPRSFLCLGVGGGQD